MWKTVAAVSLIAVLSGCSTYSASRYAISADNVVALRSLQDQKLTVGDFTSTPRNDETGAPLTEIMCRGVGPIKTPDGESFASYIQKAMVDEMKMAEVYDPDSRTSISGNLDSINFSSMDGRWDIDLTLKSTNGHSMSLTESYAYKTSFYGETACNQTAQALMPAIQNLVGNAVRSSDFKNLVSD